MTRRAIVAVAACVLLTASNPTPVHAQDLKNQMQQRALAADSSLPQHVVFSISGGISLGAYQAGVNWAMLQAFQQAWRDSSYPIDRVELATVTGASAGNINTLFWATEWCRRLPASGPLPPADSTLFWNLWVERADVHHLLPSVLEDSAELGLLDRRPLVGTLVDDLTRRSTETRDAACTMPIGITLTSVRPELLEVPRARFAIQTQRFATLFRAENAATPDGRRLRFMPLDLKPGFAASRFGMTFRMRSGPDGIAFAQLVDAVRASSSFPFAFSPVELVDSTGPRLFMDGGVFDNNPVALALALYDNRVDSRREPTVVYVNPGLRRPLDQGDDAARRDVRVAGGLTPAVTLLRGAVSAARQYELQLLARDQAIAQMRPNWVFSDRYAPLMGSHLGAFGAFLAYAFREHDFYVGVYDGLVLLARRFSDCAETDDACVAALVDQLRDDPMLSMPDAGTALIDALYRDEFNEHTQAMTVRCTETWSELTPEQGLPLAVACALLERPTEEVECTERDATSRILCGEGLDRVFAALAERRGLIDRCALECADAERRQGAVWLADWIERPTAEGAQLLDLVLQRAVEVERRAGTRYADGRRTDFEIPLEAVSLLYYASSFRRGNHVSSVPGYAPDAWRGFPNAITWGMREEAIEARWEYLIWHLVDVGPVLHYNSRPVLSDGAHLTLGGAAGLSVRGPIDPTGLILSRLGVQAELFSGELVEVFDNGSDWFPGYYAFADLFAGKLRIGYRYMPEAGSLHGRGHNGWMVGFSDVTGSLYWLAQIAAKPGTR